MTTARTDIHRPSAPEFDPESYDLFGVFDLRPEWPGGAQSRIAVVNHWLDQGYSFAGAPHGSDQCSHCGTWIRYAALMGHAPTKTLLYIGETCLDERFALTAGEFKALRARAAAQAKASREANARNETKEAVLRWLAEDASPILVELSYRGNGGTVDSNEFLSDIARKLFQYGDLTPRQGTAAHDAIEREYTRQGQWEARLRADAERKATAAPAPSGRVRVSGTVGATWTQDSDYGVAFKARVTDEWGGFVVITTIPKALFDQLGGNYDHVGLRGRKVEFTATLTPIDDDPTTAWANRPSKARLLG